MGLRDGTVGSGDGRRLIFNGRSFEGTNLKAGLCGVVVIRHAVGIGRQFLGLVSAAGPLQAGEYTRRFRKEIGNRSCGLVFPWEDSLRWGIPRRQMTGPGGDLACLIRIGPPVMDMTAASPRETLPDSRFLCLKALVPGPRLCLRPPIFGALPGKPLCAFLF